MIYYDNESGRSFYLPYTLAFLQGVRGKLETVFCLGDAIINAYKTVNRRGFDDNGTAKSYLIAIPRKARGGLPTGNGVYSFGGNVLS